MPSEIERLLYLTPQIRPRDSQRSKMYKAERQVWIKQFDPRHETMAECERYLRYVTNTQFFRDLWYHNRRRHLAKQPAELRMEDGRGCLVARGNFGGYVNVPSSVHLAPEVCMKLPRWARSEMVMLHELCHSITANNHAAHGWAFCHNYLEMVTHFMGVDMGNALRAAYKRCGVKHRPKRQVAPLSEERKATLRAQLAKARAAKVAA